MKNRWMNPYIPAISMIDWKRTIKPECLICPAIIMQPAPLPSIRKKSHNGNAFPRMDMLMNPPSTSTIPNNSRKNRIRLFFQSCAKCPMNSRKYCLSSCIFYRPKLNTINIHCKWLNAFLLKINGIINFYIF